MGEEGVGVKAMDTKMTDGAPDASASQDMAETSPKTVQLTKDQLDVLFPDSPPTDGQEYTIVLTARSGDNNGNQEFEVTDVSLPEAASEEPADGEDDAEAAPEEVAAMGFDRMKLGRKRKSGSGVPMMTMADMEKE